MVVIVIVMVEKVVLVEVARLVLPVLINKVEIVHNKHHLYLKM